MGSLRAGLVLPKVIGHRGAAGHAPENTLAAFRIAHDLGIGWVEFDVHLTADGRCIVLHDDTVDRTTDGSGVAAFMHLDEIGALDAGAWFDPRFAGETVPTLEETIDLLEELELGANIEIKPHPGREVETAEAVCRLLQATWPDALPPPLVSSFAYEALEVAYRIAPSIARGLLIENIDADWRSLAEGVDAVTVNCDQTRLTMAQAHEIRLAGYGLMVYTVNNAGRARELFRWGVNSIFSDVPEQLLVAGE